MTPTCQKPTIEVLGNQADAVIWLNFQEPSSIFLEYIRFVICCIYSLVCKGIRFIPSQTNMRLRFCNMKTEYSEEKLEVKHPKALPSPAQ